MIDPRPTFSKPVIGFRVWKLALDGMLLPRSVSALERLEVEPWRPGRNDARCVYLGRSRGQHASPDRHCDCGLYAYHDVSQLARAVRAEGCIAGSIVAWGELQVHRGGFRAEHAQVVALALPERPPLVAPAWAAAERYGVPLMSMAQLETCVAERAEPLPMSVRPTRWQWLHRGAGVRQVQGKRVRPLGSGRVVDDGVHRSTVR